MTLPASDSLNNSGATVAIQTYSSNWTALAGTIQVASGGGGAFPSNTGANSAAVWNADTFPLDQYAQCVLNNIGGASGIFIGPAVRQSNAGTLTEYALRVAQVSSQWQVIKFVSNTFTNISGTQSGTFSNGDVIKIQVIGTTLTAFQNSTVLYTTTDSSINGTSSAAGLATSGNNSGNLVKNWQAGSAASSTPLYMYSVRNVLYFI